MWKFELWSNAIFYLTQKSKLKRHIINTTIIEWGASAISIISIVEMVSRS
jgi:hypothetical protein